MLNKFGFFEQLEAGVPLTQQVKQQVDPKALVQAAASQFNPSQSSKTQSLEEGKSTKSSNTQTQQDVKALYGIDDIGKIPSPEELLEKKSVSVSVDETQKNEVRKKLWQQQHNEVYFNQINNPPKPKEPRPAEKVEEEKERERWELLEKEKKTPKPLVVDMAERKKEAYPGVSG